MKWLSTIKQRIFAAKQGARRPQVRDPHVLSRDQHNISRKHISDGALKVMSRLHSSGFSAYMVGGSVRDLLLGKRPKDFDIATDARPEQVREVFRNSRIIGRRFKIVHVRFGPEIIEVTTFRGSHDPVDADDDVAPDPRQSARSEDGMLLRDNVYGSVEEDAVRRDFTVNALYYTTKNFAVYDYTTGIADLDARVIRIIGEPETRYREDPVRMLRAVRFAAKLDFTIEPATAAPIRRLAPMLANVPAARMFDEVLKLLMAGHGAATYQLMREHALFEALFPTTAEAMDAGWPLAEEVLIQALHNTDERIAAGKPVTPAFIYAALLWPALQRQVKNLVDAGVPEQLAIQQAAQEIIDRQQHHTAVPRRFSQPMREIWELQWRLPKRDSRRIQNLLDNPRLRAGYDFLLLREQAGEELDGLGEWWTEFLNADEDGRADLLRKVGQRGAGPRRRRTRKART